MRKLVFSETYRSGGRIRILIKDGDAHLDFGYIDRVYRQRVVKRCPTCNSVQGSKRGIVGYDLTVTGRWWKVRAKKGFYTLKALDARPGGQLSVRFKAKWRAEQVARQIFEHEYPNGMEFAKS